MASTFPENNSLVSGVVVVKDFQYTIMDTGDLKDYGLQTTAVVQRQMVPYHASFTLLKYHLRQMFGKIEELERSLNKQEAVRIFETVDVKEYNANHVLLEWTGNATNDMVADSVLAVILNIESSPASVKLTKSDHKHSHSHGQPIVHGQSEEKKKDQLSSKPEMDLSEASSSTSTLAELAVAGSSSGSVVSKGMLLIDRTEEDEFQDLVMFFSSQFGPENLKEDYSTKTIEITMDGVVATVDCATFQVQCDADALRHRTQNVLERAVRTCMQ